MHPAGLAHRSPKRRGAANAPTVETESATNTLQFQCPNTDRVFDSGIGADCSARLISIRARCPMCEGLHDWLVAGESFVAVSSTEHPLLSDQIKTQSAEIIKLREQLLDELNHRLRNNLKILMGLLQIAWRKTDNKEARDVLLDTRRRVGAMRTAQQVFYSVHNSTDVSGHSFLEAVCANARAFFAKGVSINREAATGSLPKETALPLALVLNELLTNAAKHGANERGRVKRGAESSVGRDRSICARPRIRIRPQGGPRTIIGSLPGDDVDATAPWNLRGGAKVWSPLHSANPGSMKCRSSPPADVGGS
jgi:two-component sensor histidine kinase